MKRPSIQTCATGLSCLLLALASTAPAQCAIVYAGIQGTNGDVYALATMPNGDLVVGGWFTAAGGVAASNIARWDGTSWSALGSGVDGSVSTLLALPNGDLIAGGGFTTAGGVVVNKVARWNGTAWSSLGTGMFGSPAFVNAAVVLPNGDLVVGGDFVSAGGVAADNIARWDGSSWSPLGSGSNLVLKTMVVLPNGDLLATGGYINHGGLVMTFARWNGTSWTPLTANNIIVALTTAPNGDVIAAGDFTNIGGVAANRIARFDGSSWSAIGSGMNLSVNTVLAVPNGDLVAGGAFSNAGGVPASRLARWNGAAWSALGLGANDRVYALGARPDGDVFAGGVFTSAGGFGTPFLARLATTCPASATITGSGCAGSGGANTLTASTLPWTGSTFRATGTGLPALALVSEVYGFTPTLLPLSLLLPQGQPGCDLLVTPDHVNFSVASGGAATTQLAIPGNPVLAGMALRHQLNLFEVDPALNILAVTASNALLLTIGTW